MSRITLNLSRVEIRDDLLVDLVGGMLERHGTIDTTK